MICNNTEFPVSDIVFGYEAEPSIWFGHKPASTIMGKGTVADWHKQQRKKELQKNKESRLAVRNEKVLSEKTVGSVRKEVERLEQQHGKSVPHTVQMKIDRLKKELKLLQEKEAEDKKNRVHRKSYVKPTVFEPLAKPAMSVYYDERFNPYGEPPPGQPRMFHKRGGGTTLRIDEACVPGEEEEMVEEESKSAETATPQKTPNADSSSSDVASSQKTKKDPALHQTSSYSRESKHHSSTTDTTSPAPPKATVQPFDPSHMPDLPPPSAAVKRSRGTVDIWASAVEEDYNTAAATHWYYTDTAGQQQGPFATQQMKEWNNYFPPDTPVRPSSSMEWRPMHTVKELRVKKKAAPRPKGGVLDRIAALRDSNTTKPSTAADRIAALRGDTAPSTMTNDEMDANDRIAALRSDLMADNGVQDRLAALRGDRDRDARVTEGDDVQGRIAALKSQMQPPAEDAVDNEVAERIAELRAMKQADSTDSLPIPPPETASAVPPPVDPNMIPASSSVDPYLLPIPPPPAGPNEIPPCIPLPPPPPSIDASSIPPSIPLPPPPMDSNTIPPSFPVPPPPSSTTDIPPAYPPPPTAETADVPPAFPMPPTDVPPSFPSPSAMDNPPPKKKKAKVDKSLVAFVPSHLLRNKR